MRPVYYRLKGIDLQAVCQGSGAPLAGRRFSEAVEGRSGAGVLFAGSSAQAFFDYFNLLWGFYTVC